MRDKLHALLGALGRATIPPELCSLIGELDRSTWPEMSQQWSLLTPSGFPIEVTVAKSTRLLRWVGEIAGPEVGEHLRLARVAAVLAAARQPIDKPVLEALADMQCERELSYGAWLGGKSSEDGTSRYKLYAEVPCDVPLSALPLPNALQELCDRTPEGTRACMLGFEPARRRVELYLGLPHMLLDDLRPVLREAGYPDALETLDRCLPDGLRRLTGRRLGLSLALAKDEPYVEAALFASARTLFPGSPELLGRLVPEVARVHAAIGRATVVSIGLIPEHRELEYAVGMTVPNCTRRGGFRALAQALDANRALIASKCQGVH